MAGGSSMLVSFSQKLLRINSIVVTSFACSWEKWDVGYCGKLSKVKERVPLAERERVRRERFGPGKWR